jgi:GT2 family glycosyltransferase
MSSRVNLSIIILNYDTLDVLTDCLDSIARFPPDCTYEIIIVNNGSPRDRAQDLSKLHAKARVYDLPVNVGFGQANNLGMQVAKGEYFLLLNSDTYFVDGSLQRSVDYADSNPDIDIFTCLLEGPDGTPERSVYPVPKNPTWEAVYNSLQENVLIERFGYRAFGLSPPSASGNQWLCGAFLYLKRAVFEKTGGFDPDFFLYCEDGEWFCSRIPEAGFQAGLCEEAKIIHLNGASQTRSNQRDQLRLSSFLYHYKRKAFVAAYLTHCFNFLVRLILMPVAPWALRFNLRHQAKMAKLLLRVLWDVPSYPSDFGGRPAPLMLSVYQRTFSWSRMSKSMLGPN